MRRQREGTNKEGGKTRPYAKDYMYLTHFYNSLSNHLQRGVTQQGEALRDQPFPPKKNHYLKERRGSNLRGCFQLENQRDIYI